MPLFRWPLPLASVGAPATVTDNFNRADGGLGSNWVSSPSWPGLEIVSNRYQWTIGGTWNGAYWNPSVNTFANDQFAEATVTGHHIGIVIRHQAASTSCYLASIQGGNNVDLWRIDSGGFTGLGGQSVAATDGHVLRIEAVGSTIIVKLDGATVITVSDATYASGQPGIASYTNTPAYGDNWSAGPTAGGAPAAITGTFATTEASDIAVFNGTVNNTGTFAATEAKDVAAFSGSVGTTGTFATTEGKDVAVFNGSVNTTGTFATTEAKDVAVFSGGVSVSGALAVVEAPDIAAFNGGGAVSGTFAIIEPSDAALFNGSVYVSGVLTATEPNDVALFNVLVPVEGVLAAIEPSDVALFSGPPALEGVIEATEESDVAAFAAFVNIAVNGWIEVVDGRDVAMFSGASTVSSDVGFDFPDSPTEGQVFTPLPNINYVYEAPLWEMQPD
jgi:hypothetical protein